MNIYEVQVELYGNWRFVFLSSDDSKKVKSVCNEFKSMVIENYGSYSKEVIADEFYKFLLCSGVSYLIPNIEKILL